VDENLVQLRERLDQSIRRPAGIIESFVRGIVGAVASGDQ